MDPHHGRGAGENPVNRFEALGFEADEDAWLDDDPRPLRTTFLRDDSQSILSRNTAEDFSVMARFRQPVAIVTKNALVARDIDHLAELARHGAVFVYLSITTLDSKLARILGSEET